MGVPSSQRWTRMQNPTCSGTKHATRPPRELLATAASLADICAAGHTTRIARHSHDAARFPPAGPVAGLRCKAPPPTPPAAHPAMSGGPSPVQGVEGELLGLREVILARVVQYQQLKADGREEAKLRWAEVQADMARFRGLLRDMELCVEEEDESEDAERWAMSANRHKQTYAELQQALRVASAQARRAIETAALRNRRALLGTADPQKRAMQLETQADLANAAADVTASLQRTRQVMVEELDHTSATLAAMDTTTATLRAARDEYGGQRTRIQRSHGLLRTMQRHSVLDRLYLWGGVAVFSLVVLYLLQKRLVYFVPRGLLPGLSWKQASSNSTFPPPGTSSKDVPQWTEPAPDDPAFWADNFMGTPSRDMADFGAGSIAAPARAQASAQQLMPEMATAASSLNSSTLEPAPPQGDVDMSGSEGEGRGATLLPTQAGPVKAVHTNKTKLVEADHGNATALEQTQDQFANATPKQLKADSDGLGEVGTPMHLAEQPVPEPSSEVSKSTTLVDSYEEVTETSNPTLHEDAEPRDSLETSSILPALNRADMTPVATTEAGPEPAQQPADREDAKICEDKGGLEEGAPGVGTEAGASEETLADMAEVEGVRQDTDALEPLDEEEAVDVAEGAEQTRAAGEEGLPAIQEQSTQEAAVEAQTVNPAMQEGGLERLPVADLQAPAHPEHSPTSSGIESQGSREPADEDGEGNVEHNADTVLPLEHIALELESEVPFLGIGLEEVGESSGATEDEPHAVGTADVGGSMDEHAQPSVSMPLQDSSTAEDVASEAQPLGEPSATLALLAGDDADRLAGPADASASILVGRLPSETLHTNLSKQPEQHETAMKDEL